MQTSTEISKQLKQSLLLRCKALFTNSMQVTHVWVADKPPRLGGVPRKITVEEFNKMIGNDFIYTENVHVDRKAKINLEAIHSREHMRLAILNFLKSPLNDKLAVCYMGEQLGYGVFTRIDIAIGETVAIYAGELKEASEKKSKRNTAYGLDVDTFTGQSSFYIDAAECGSVARFFQHLPLNADELARHLVCIFRNDPSQIEKYVTRTAFTSEFSEFECKKIIQDFTVDVMYGTGEMVKGMLTYAGDGQPGKDWQLKRLRLNNTSPNQIASANLEVDSIVVDNKPIIFFWAARNILAGEQLGFDYGFGYWSNLHRLPLLFDTNGNVVPKKDYSYTEMPLMVSTTQGDRCFFYDVAKYRRDMIKPEPVYFSMYAKPVSLFWLRKKLAKNNIIAPINLPRVDLNTFTGHLKEILPDDFKIYLFERVPESSKKDERYCYDVVCKARSPDSWAIACKILKNSIINPYCTFYQSLQEILIKSVNIHTAEMHGFVKDYFDKKAMSNKIQCK